MMPAMAAPKRNRNKRSDPLFEKSRARIQTTQLVKRLQCNALGEKDDAGNEVKLSTTEIRSIEILLDKSIPNLASVKLIGDAEQPLATRNELIVKFVDEKRKGKS